MGHTTPLLFVHTFTCVAISLQGEPIQTSALVGPNGVVALLRAATIANGTFIHISCNTKEEFTPICICMASHFIQMATTRKL